MNKWVWTIAIISICATAVALGLAGSAYVKATSNNVTSNSLTATKVSVSEKLTVGKFIANADGSIIANVITANQIVLPPSATRHALQSSTCEKGNQGPAGPQGPKGKNNCIVF